MKRKLLFSLLMSLALVCLMAICISAEVYNITYWDGGTKKDTVQTDETGTITLRDTPYSGAGNEVTNWFTYEGDIFAMGETITVTKDTDIHQFSGHYSTNLNINSTSSQWGWQYIQLQEDLVLESTISINDGGRLFVDLNGHSIISGAKNVFSQRRAGLFIVGEGSIIHTGSGHLFNTEIHGYDDRKVGFVLGKNVTVETPGNLCNFSNRLESGWITEPVVFEVHGTVKCNRLLSVNGVLDEILNAVIDPMKIEVADKLMHFNSVGEAATVNLTIGNGTFLLPDGANSIEYWNNGAADKYVVTVENGANFTNGGLVVLSSAGEGKAITSVTIDDVKYDVITNDSCQHGFDINVLNASCVNLKTSSYICPLCGESFAIRTGALAEHIWELINHIPATETTPGTKSYKCEVCSKEMDQSYSFDPTNLEINVTVSINDPNTGDAYEKVVTVLVSDVLKLDSIETMGAKIYTLTGLKSFDVYDVASIVAIEIPVGISKINFSESNSTLKVLNIKNNANVIIESFSKYTGITEINIGKAKVEFASSCSNNVIQAIRSEVEGADVVFKASCFNEKKSLTELKLSAFSKYDFGHNCFRRTQIKELIFPDYSEPIFRNEAAFYDCAVEYLYVGRGIKTLMGKPFDYCQKMQKIVLMEVTSMSMEYTFCVENGGEKPVEVYIHSEELSLPNNTFYQCHGITIYTNAPITNGNAFNGCNATTKGGIDYPAYTIVYDIPHKYEQGMEDATCTKDGSFGYITDCPCGSTASFATYKTFVGTLTNSETFTEGTIETTVLPALGHLKGTLVDVVYLNGYLENGIARYDCMRCDNNGYYEEAIEPMIKSLGYSVSEFNEASMVQGYVINLGVYSLCESVNDKLTYGFIVLANPTNETQYPLSFKNGELIIDEGIVQIPVGNLISVVEIKIKGFNEKTSDTKIIMCAYLFDGTSINYISNGEATVGITGASYNELVNIPQV
ncbi:MAG: leucine-rich repeat protein [Clostridia bacterium]|nr:leucine-rich repeat protein [Clostridia bacterium]